MLEAPRVRRTVSASRAWPGLWLSHDGASSSAGPRPHHHSGVSTRMTLFGLVRHGQTDYNRQHLFQGSSDIPPNDTGRSEEHTSELQSRGHLVCRLWPCSIASCSPYTTLFRSLPGHGQGSGSATMAHLRRQVRGPTTTQE